jgi:ribosomal protein S18 acetylase RimI-like enzyme
MIREVRASDLASLADVAARTYAHTFGHTMTPAALTEELEEYRSEKYFRAAMQHDTILVDVEGDRVLGYAQINDVAFPEVAAEAGDQLLDRLYVDTAAQGRGIGRALVKAALAHPRLAQARRVFLQVWSENARALKLYRSLGFEVVGTTRLGVGDLQTSDEFIMMRPARVPEATGVN